MGHPTSLPSRRAFLRAAVAAGLAARIHAQAADARNTGYVDAHVHIWTPDTQRYPRTASFTGTREYSPASFTPEELFRHCRPEGVRRVVLIQMSFYQFDNQYMLDAMSAHPRVFAGVAVVDDTSPDLRATMQRLAGQGVRGFRLYTDKPKAEAWPSAPGMKTMCSQAADAGLAMCLLTGPEALPAIRQMCARYPKTRVVIDHCARIGAKGEILQSDLDELCRLATFENVYVKTSAFYALGAKRSPYLDLGPMVRKLRDAYGAARLMWASDCPFQVQDGRTYADSIALIRDRLDFLSADDKAWMLRKTAEKVYFG
jgi:predicted TIM-barrel fold metal-dependent hydrolase